MTDTPTEREDEGAWSKLRRRKVVQWGIAYAAGAWGLLQGLQFLVDAFEWPSRVLQLGTVAAALGLPIVLVLAWYHGDRGEQKVSRGEIAIVTLVFLVGGGLYWRCHHASDSASAPVAAATSPTAVPSDKSIAVLPFVNMSADPEQAYFADGISEELLNLLTQVPELRVIARTSSFAFKGKDIAVPDIARQLHVTFVLEGSVRRAGQRVRITAQLIHAPDSSHLWSASWDREIGDIFAIQDEIAADVVRALKVKLLNAVPRARATDPEAYAHYLQAVQLGRQFTAAAFAKSDAMYRQVLVTDPRYAPAWEGLATNYVNETSLGLLSSQEGTGRAREAVAKALEIEPEFAKAYADLGWLAMVDNDLVGAAHNFERALALDPADLRILGNAASLLQSLGRKEESLALLEAIARRDPVNVTVLFNLGIAQRWAGQPDQSINTYRTVLNLSPGRGGAHYGLGEALFRKDDASAALAEIEQETSEFWRMIGLPMAYYALARHAESDAALAALIAKYEKDSSYNIACVYAFRREPDRVFEWLDKAVAYGDPGLSEIVIDDVFSHIQSDPRWLPFLRKLGKAPEQLAAIEFEVTLPE